MTLNELLVFTQNYYNLSSQILTALLVRTAGKKKQEQ